MLSHRQPARMDEMSELSEQNSRAINVGSICRHCYDQFKKPYGVPTACEDCGGKGKIKEAVEGDLE